MTSFDAAQWWTEAAHSQGQTESHTNQAAIGNVLLMMEKNPAQPLCEIKMDRKRGRNRGREYD